MSETPETCPFCNAPRDSNPNGVLWVCGTYKHGKEPYQSDLCSEREDSMELHQQLAAKEQELAELRTQLEQMDDERLSWKREAESRGEENAELREKNEKLNADYWDLIQLRGDLEMQYEEIQEMRRDLRTREEGGKWVSIYDHEDAIAELRQDRERLDWLSERFISGRGVDGNAQEARFWLMGKFNSYRDAIDAAIRHSQTENGEGEG